MRPEDIVLAESPLRLIVIRASYHKDIWLSILLVSAHGIFLLVISFWERTDRILFPSLCVSIVRNRVYFRLVVEQQYDVIHWPL